VFNADYQVTQKLGYVELDFWELDWELKCAG
jgi:hypothetical protein